MSDEENLKVILSHRAELLPKIEKTKEEKNRRNKAKRHRKKYK